MSDRNHSACVCRQSVTTLKLTCGHCNVMKRESKGCAAIQHGPCETPELFLERLKPKHMVT